MPSGFHKRYLLAVICIVGGYLFLFMMDGQAAGYLSTPCLFKLVSGIPCPGCGMGRATLALASGHIADSFHYNILCIPFSIAVAVLLVWFTIDLLRSRETVYPLLMRPMSRPVTIVLGILLVSTWLLNILHGI